MGASYARWDDSLENNHTWDLAPRLNENNVVECQWVYRTKFIYDGVFEHHKDRILVKGFSQQEGIDYTKTFAPIENMNFVQLILSLATHFRLEIHQMDVKSSFLHGKLFEEFYMEQSPNFMTDSTLVCWLKKSLYGLK